MQKEVREILKIRFKLAVLGYNLNIRRDDLDTFGNGTDGDSIILERLPFIIF